MAQDEVHRIENLHGDVAVLSYALLDPAAIDASLRDERDGAVVSFVGYTRDNFQGRTVTHLTYEAYIPLALKTIVSLFQEARNLPSPEPFSHAAAHACCARPHSHAVGHPHVAPVPDRIELGKIYVAHLLGPSPPRTPSIVIAVSSPHRREAFFLAEWMLERVKERVQVWKREWYADQEDAPPIENETGQFAAAAAAAAGARREPDFVGRDGSGLEGHGGRPRALWKENFPPAKPRLSPRAVAETAHEQAAAGTINSAAKVATDGAMSTTTRS